jgi:hypothetical protein
VLTVPLPAPFQVRRLLEDLLGRDVQVAPSIPWAPTRPDDGAIALFVDDDLVPRTVAVLDARFSAYAGASIGLVPPHLARAALGNGELPPYLQENLQEVLNVVAALFNGEDTPHLRLYSVHHHGGDATLEVLALGGVLGHRLDLTVGIAGYGTGRLGLVRVG